MADVDRAVAALLESERLGGQAAKVAFDAPKKEWAAARTAPTLNLFLADIREDLTRRTTTLIEEVGEKLRGMMHWAQNDRLVDKSRN